MYIPQYIKTLPNFGSKKGGNMIIIRGNGIGQNFDLPFSLICLFGKMKVIGNIVNNSVAICTSPDLQNIQMYDSIYDIKNTNLSKNKNENKRKIEYNENIYHCNDDALFLRNGNTNKDNDNIYYNNSEYFCHYHRFNKTVKYPFL